MAMPSERHPHLLMRPEPPKGWLSQVQLSPQTFLAGSHGARERKKIHEIEKQCLCSIIGTCMTPSQLKKVLSKVLTQPVQLMSDHEIHGHAVTHASHAGEAARLMQKTLDRLHALRIQQYDACDSDAELSKLWDKDFEAGDVAGAYWALLTHPDATVHLIQRVFGEVHMLSHQVGAINRADLKKLAEYKSQLNQLQSDLASERTQHQDRVASLERQLRDEAQEHGLQLERLKCELRSEHLPKDFNLELTQSLQKSALEAQRRESAEQALAILKMELHAAKQKWLDERAMQGHLRKELNELELELTAAMRQDAVPSSAHPVRGLTLLYVGGRRSLIPQIKHCLDRLGATLLHHDGGIEERTQVLQQLVLKSDGVLFPVDAISHESMNLIKTHAGKFDKPLVPLRTSGLGSLLMALNSWQTTHSPTSISSSTFGMLQTRAFSLN